ncbi:MAG TPA: site-specific integrase [Patescibacteria group bacterium]|nr:site-specific integrase [Patescibacteria group bacterium]
MPTEKELDALIAGTGKKTSTLLQLLKETAIRIGEACNLTWDDIDFVSGVMRVTPEKGSNPRVFRVSKKLINMLASVKATRYIKDPNRIFTKLPKSCRKVYTSQRDRIAAKLQNPRLKKIGFHTFRHWKGTRVYHETKDILYTKQFLGHKSLTSTMKYIHLEEAHFKERNDKYVTKVARTVEEAIPLLELGYEEATDFDGVKIFRKVKSEVW